MYGRIKGKEGIYWICSQKKLGFFPGVSVNNFGVVIPHNVGSFQPPDILYSFVRKHIDRYSLLHDHIPAILFIAKDVSN